MPTSHWYAVAQSREVAASPLARDFFETPIVLFRDAAGRPSAMLDRCPHRNAPLSHGWVKNGLLTCPYHGWTFDGAGQCRDVPGLMPGEAKNLPCVPTFPTAEVHGIVWLWGGPDEPEAPPRIEFIERPGYISAVREFFVEATLVDAAENFLDPAHTYFVHQMIRGKGTRRPVRTVIRHGPDFAEADYTNEGAPSGLISRLFGPGITRTVGRLFRPGRIELDYWSKDRLKFRIALFFTPRSPVKQQVIAVVAGNPSPLPGWLVRRPLLWMLGRLVRQDQDILALQARNLRRFGEPKFRSTENDLMRSHIVRLLADGPDISPGERETTMWL